MASFRQKIHKVVDVQEKSLQNDQAYEFSYCDVLIFVAVVLECGNPFLDPVHSADVVPLVCGGRGFAEFDFCLEVLELKVFALLPKENVVRSALAITSNSAQKSAGNTGCSIIPVFLGHSDAILRTFLARLKFNLWC